jgi:hypothetical protein
MAKIYLTGMTAPQASPSSNSRNLAFAGVLNSVLTKRGHSVVWGDPELDITEDFFNQFDLVLVGVGAITSLSANRVYGALNIIDMLWGSDKLKLFLDAPGTSQVGASLRSIAANPTQLLKEFYSYRKGYKEVISNVALSSRIANAVQKLAAEQWPKTLYPSLPWKSDIDAGKKLPINAAPSLVGVNLDAHLILDQPIFEDKTPKWVVDSTTLKDTQKLVATLGFPISPMKWNKGCTDDQVMDQIARSTGAIIATNKGDGSWWTYRYVQAFNSLTPVYTSWDETFVIGESWSLLAHSIEDLTMDQKIKLAVTQRLDYLNSIPNKETSIKSLEDALNISGAERK